MGALIIILVIFCGLSVSAEEPIHHPQTPVNFMPEFYVLVEEAPAMNASTVTARFRTFAGCRLAEVVANKQPGVAAFCVPPQWLAELPPQMRPSVSPDLVREMERGE